MLSLKKLSKLSPRLFKISSLSWLKGRRHRVLVIVDDTGPTFQILFKSLLKPDSEFSLSIISIADLANRKNYWLFWNLILLLYRPTSIFLSRAELSRQPQIVRFLQNRRFIYHLDDDLVRVPESVGLKVHARYNEPKVVESRNWLIANCNVLYLSTPELKKRFPDFTDKIIVQNCYRPYSHHHNQNWGEKKLGYMGSTSHQKDLNKITQWIEKLLDACPSAKFEVIGDLDLSHFRPQYSDRITKIRPVKEYDGFLSLLRSRRWAIGLAPLEDNDFNKCKAPTKFVEYCESGAVTVASRVLPYSDLRDSGVIYFEDPTSVSVAAHILNDETEYIDLLQRAQDYSRTRFSTGEHVRSLKHVLGIE